MVHVSSLIQSSVQFTVMSYPSGSMPKSSVATLLPIQAVSFNFHHVRERATHVTLCAVLTCANTVCSMTCASSVV